LVDTVLDLHDTLLIDWKLHARFEVKNYHAGPVLKKLLSTRQVELLSLMDHTPGQGQYRNLERYIDTIAKWRKVPREFIEDVIRERIKSSQSTQPAGDVVGEVTKVAAEYNIPVASHDDDTREKIDHISNYHVTMSEFPVTLEAAQESKSRGIWVVMGAPNLLLGGSHSGNLCAREAIEAGAVDLLAADYYPGALVQATFLLDFDGVLPLHEAARLTSYNPAVALGLHDRGSIEVGKLADLVLVEPSERRLGARVRGVLRRGVPIYWDKQMTCRCNGWFEGMEYTPQLNSILTQAIG
jgi:alpha-D-ribose 1-methylphosphonate 5-triphosphate diphosphatase